MQQNKGTGSKNFLFRYFRALQNRPTTINPNSLSLITFMIMQSKNCMFVYSFTDYCYHFAIATDGYLLLDSFLMN